MAKGKEDELKIGEEQKEITEEPERVTPDVEADFMGLLKDYGVGEKPAKTITKHIAETGTADVFEDPKQLLEKMAKFPRHIPPVTRKNILDHWTATRNIPVPEGFAEEAELSAEELKAKRKPVSEPEKYSVDTETGAIKVASTTDKTALTWDEAEKLAKDIKRDIETREKKTAEAEKKAKAEAKSGEEGKESPFIVDGEGNWQLNPKAKISGMELLAFEAMRKSQERGEPADPFEILAKQAERIETMRSVFGGGRGGGGLLDSVEDLIKLKSLLGADEDTKALLSGIYKRLSEGGEGKGESEDVKALRDELKDLNKKLEEKERERLTGQITGLQNEMSNIRGELAKARTEAGATNEYGIMSDAIKVVDRRLGAMENALQGFFGRRPPLLGEGEKRELTQAIGKEAKEEAELDELADIVFYK